MTTGMLLISHVPKIAAGVAELIRQVAPDINLTTAGGTSSGEIGTDMDHILAAIDENKADELMVFYDLGSAKMNLDLATDFSEKPLIRYDVAFLEGAYSAAALLQSGVPRSEIEKQLAPLKIK
ncbi:dihydroxyacetone kinase phosphoryl donor subunit DhaM [Lacticaseibacillus saniviri]|uniref:phosphoenolpyruvate--glycerone phosphotransferase n=1 Tax=Lacticaseibacillus saniviri JCM 17471 = DSM 24301 TaxID=1293598 RepID=A0A0R2MPH0_9LACO|nr:dihydroxyacetone kinase phosphoryl donor subunit DhaM [Lacticaseibacillus saniviri]KRO15550.1 dihydroxyacetone kinase, phosphotransfer subunit [Lacticaseibacillus saniviri JCM 17471 = DSM 24301]MCG4281628.1 PTS-dependent dihydroxyacetone kinase phosphotransferase subunit DhaM [Lacticaseibacillus saniviri]